MKSWIPPKIWLDETAYILGGGPSLNDANLSLVHEKHVIGVNNAYALGSWVDVCWFGDCRWYDWHKQKLLEFAGLKVTCCAACAGEPGIKVMPWGKKRTGIDTTPGHVAWNSNSGASAVNLAVHLGIKKVILVGFDMHRIEGKPNWHKGHPRQANKDPYDKYLKNFATVRKDLEEIGITCINATPGSALKSFPVMTLEEAIVTERTHSDLRPLAGRFQGEAI